jgi:tetracycline repressor-like protein
MAKKADRRVQRTQQLLEAALLSLIKQKPFDAISVQEIIDRANVGRATFYAHYDNKVDLRIHGRATQTSVCSRSVMRSLPMHTSIATHFRQWWENAEAL